MSDTILYKLKNATVRITPYGKREVTKSYKQIQKEINEYKLAMAKYERNTDMWQDYRREIQFLRGNFEGNNSTKKKIDPAKADWKIKKLKNITYIYEIELKSWSKFKKQYIVEIREGADMVYYRRRQVAEYVRRAIQDDRRSRKPVDYEDFMQDQVMFTSGKAKTGRVFTKPDQFLKIHVRKNLKSLYADKTPTTMTNYLGVEIEFCAPISEEKMAIQLFKAGFQKYVQLKKDGSLRPHEGETGFEFAMLLREGSYKKDLKKVTDFIASVKGQAVDRRCGLHVHFDMRKRKKDMVFNNLVACQTVLLSLVDPRRYDNEFCRLVNSKKFPISFKNTREERYKTINAAAFYRHKTLEVRMHEGTVAFEDMSNWIDVLLKIVNYKKIMKSNINNLPVLKKRVKLNERTYKAVLDKSCYWQINHGDFVQRNLRAQEELAQQTLRAMDRADQGQVTHRANGLDVATFTMPDQPVRRGNAFEQAAQEMAVEHMRRHANATWTTTTVPVDAAGIPQAGIQPLEFGNNGEDLIDTDIEDELGLD